MAIDERSSGVMELGTRAGHNHGLELALERAKAGWPVHRLKPGDNAPATPNGFKDATTDAGELRRMFVKDGNVGTPGTERDLILDIDVPKADARSDLGGAERCQIASERLAVLFEWFPETKDAPLVGTPGGGYHVYLTLPERYVGAQSGEREFIRTGRFPRSVPEGEKWGEVRGMVRAYVAVWGCVRPDGIYSAIREPSGPGDAPEASDELIAWMTMPAPSSDGEAVDSVGLVGVTEMRRVGGDPERYARGVLEGVRSRLGNTPKGRRHLATLDEARALGKWVQGYADAGLVGLTHEQARDVLEQATDANGYRGEERRACDGTIRDGLQYGMARPFEVTRAEFLRHDDRNSPASDRDTTATRIGTPDGHQAGTSSGDIAVAGSEALDPNTMTPALARALASFNLTDLGNGERFALLNADRVRFCHGRGPLVWDGRRWAPDRDGMVYRYAGRTARATLAAAAYIADRERRREFVKFALQTEKGRGLSNMIERAWKGQEVRDLTVAADDLDADPDVFNAWNGTVHIPSGELRPHDPADLITKVSSVEYHADADAPLWRAFQERITAGDAELQAFKQRALGFTLTGHTREQVVLIAYGTGANGKSTELEAIAEIAGDYAQTTSFDTFATNRDEKSRRFALAPLAGARFVRAVEGDIGTRLAEGTLKMITGGERIWAEYKGRDGFEYTPRFKLWLASNHKPQTRGTDHGLWRRIRLVPYTVTIPEAERDPELPDKLRAELPGILAWLVQGARTWYRDGLGTATAVTAATDEYRTEMDSLAGFFADAADANAKGREGSSRLHAAYRGWCEANGERHMSMKAFAQALQERGLEKEKTRAGMVWRGVCLTPAGERLADRRLERDGGRYS